MTIQLQSVGKVPAQPASNIKVGTRLMWNFGSVSEVLEIVKETAKTITIKEKVLRSDYIGERKLFKNRLVAIM